MKFGEGFGGTGLEEEEDTSGGFEITNRSIQGVILRVISKPNCDLALMIACRTKELTNLPGLQRRWIGSSKAQVNVIESLLNSEFRCPRSTMDGIDESKCLVVLTGLQRLSTLRSFYYRKDLATQRPRFSERNVLEESSTSSPEAFQRRNIRTQLITVFLIKRKHLLRSSFNIFQEITTGVCRFRTRNSVTPLIRYEPLFFCKNLPIAWVPHRTTMKES